MTFVGLALHKRYITACAIDADGTPRGDACRLSVSHEVVLQVLADLPCAGQCRGGGHVVLGLAA